MPASPDIIDTGTTDLVAERHEGDIVVLTLNRPGSANAVSFEMWQGFDRVLGLLEHDTPIRGLVLKGSNSLFCIGGDMKIAPAGGEGALSPATRLEWGQRIITRLRALPVPVIAAVERGAYGIGWSIAMACDLIYASREAKFGAPFVDYGLTPDGGAAWFLNRLVGRHRAAELLFTGKTLTAQEAFDYGIVSKLCEPDDVISQAIAFAQGIGQGNRQAVELTKRLLHTADHGDLSASHALELAYCAILQKGDELQRAKAAFAARSKEKSKS